MPPKLKAALEKHSTARRDAFMDHLVGGTSSEWLAAWLERAGTPVKPTTIKLARRNLA